MIDERNRKHSNDDNEDDHDNTPRNPTRPDGSISGGPENTYTDSQGRVVIDPRNEPLDLSDDDK